MNTKTTSVVDLWPLRSQLMRDGVRFEFMIKNGPWATFTVKKTTVGLGLDAIYTPFSGLSAYYSISKDGFGGSMNVSKFGPTCITVYSYDMLGNKTTGKFPYNSLMLVD